MGTAFGVIAGQWWRFDRYEVRDGSIRPAPGAKLSRYDPCVAYWGGDAPYRSLLTLLDQLPTQPDRDGIWRLTPQREDQLLAWCAEHGLLGGLLQATQRVTLAPRWEPLPAGASLPGPDYAPTEDALHPMQREYIRHCGRWGVTCNVKMERRTTAHRGPHGEVQPVVQTMAILQTPDRRGKLVTESDILNDCREPSVVWHDLRGYGLWHEQPLRFWWARFFPDVPAREAETFGYPIPGEPRFWRMYSEPIGDFLDFAMILRDAITGLSLHEANAPEQAAQITEGLQALNALVEGISPTLAVTEGGGYRQEWVAPSLLATFAMMVLHDLTQGQRVLLCACCGIVFLSAAWQARYCSERCRRTFQQRRHRERTRAQQRPA